MITPDVYEADRRVLWGMCYRMTGNAADADDLVQETFVRAIERPPRRLDQPLRPWLVRVAMNLSRDYLRARRRRGYKGPWLPSPVPTGELSEAQETLASYEPPAPPDQSPAARYDLMESVSFAFLLALEALTPSQRAVLLLRDVFDYSTEESAAALDLTEANVKVLLSRARRKLGDYDKQRVRIDAARREQTRRALEEFLVCLSTGDTAKLERLLSEDALSLSDGGGEVAAALRPVRGRRNVLRLFTGLAKKTKGMPRVMVGDFNGLPAVLVELGARGKGFATRFTLHLELDRSGLINRLSIVLAPSKLLNLRSEDRDGFRSTFV